MRTGIVDFQSDRLRQLRIAQGLTQAVLAEKLSCSAGNISKWENGLSYPEIASFKRICDYFKVPEDWLLESPIKDQGDTPSFFRSQVSTPKIAWDIAETRLEWLEELSFKLQESLDFPELRIPFYSGDEVGLIDDADIESLAEQCRQEWGIGTGPITNVIQTMESFGVVASRTELGYVKMDGVSRWSMLDDRPYVLLAADKASPIRNRFDAAHELGHLVLHRKISKEQYQQHYNLIENQAHRFASAFLMPAESFSFEVKWPTLDGLLSLKPRWKVSVAAMIKRCQDLELIDSDATARLWKGRSARGWVKKEPLDDSFEFEQPKLLKRSVMMLIENKILTKASLRKHLGMPEPLLEELVNLPTGYFSDEQRNTVIDIRLKPRPSKARPADLYGTGSVVSFHQKHMSE